MAICTIHNCQVGNDAICGRCKNCKHTSWFKKEGDSMWQCNNCYVTKKDPAGEKHILTKEGWKEQK